MFDSNRLEALGETQVELARRFIRARARAACRGETGISKKHSTYLTVVEDRDVPAVYGSYSSCGDLVQSIAQELGIGAPTLNRARDYSVIDIAGGAITHEPRTPGWRPGRNLLNFYDAAIYPDGQPLAVTPPKDYRPERGDFGFIWFTGSDAHTFVFGDWLDDRTIETFNYGAAGMSAADFPGGIQRKTRCTKQAGMPWQVGSRLLHKVATVPALLAAADSDRLPTFDLKWIETIEGLVP